MSAESVRMALTKGWPELDGSRAEKDKKKWKRKEMRREGGKVRAKQTAT